MDSYTKVTEQSKSTQTIWKIEYGGNIYLFSNFFAIYLANLLLE